MHLVISYLDYCWLVYGILFKEKMPFVHIIERNLEGNHFLS